ncbi:MAG: ATP-binding cassette domain-containing protein [Flavobacteriales bacterium]|nr:ATP-binding cassette domain-containing protein [Flavobacteriales bacterium]
MARGRFKEHDAPKAKLNKTTLRKALRIFRYMRPYRWHFALGFVFLIITSLLSLAFPVLLGKLMDAAPSSGSFMDSALGDLTDTASIAKLLAISFILQALFGFGRIYLFGHVSEHALTQLRKDTYSHLVRLPMSFFAQRRVGELNSRISADVALLQDLFTTVTAELVRQSIIIVLGLIMLFQLSPQLMFTMVSVVPVVAVAAVFFGRFIQKLSKQVQDGIADSGTIVDETLQGIQNVKAFANEAWEVVRYGKSVDAARTLALKGARWRGAFVSFIILCMFGAVVMVAYRAVELKNTGAIQPGEIISFIMLTVFIAAGFASIPEMFGTVLKAIGATERLLDIQEEKPEPVSLDKSHDVLKLNGRIEFRDVGFHYASREDVPVLKGVSFTAEPGERVALVGPSGAGKSTIASLLLRFYTPNEGRILIDNKDAQDYPLSALRDRMAIVPQEVLLFGGSIRENIAYGKPGASQDDIEAAARKANAHEFIERFPERYDTIVGERGIQLSGGQRQRIAIARAVLKDPAILILDEATSSLDTASEKLVQDALDQLMQGRTSFVIAHRLSTVRSADRILVLDKGIVTSSGTHDELMADTGGLYYHLSKTQLAEA